MIIASLCWFPVSNRFTVAAIFDLDWGDDEFRQHAETVAEIVNTWLTTKPSSKDPRIARCLNVPLRVTLQL